MGDKVSHTLSPSAWNRYETCPRMYWLSRQRLPRKAGMAASLGTAVHASVEDLLQVDLSGRDDMETNWLPEMAEKFIFSPFISKKKSIEIMESECLIITVIILFIFIFEKHIFYNTI